MPLNVSLSSSQVIGAPQNVVINDGTTGSDPATSTRRLYFQNATGTYEVPDGTTTNYVNWPLAQGNSITLDLLDVDMALNVTLQYVNSGGTVLAEDTVLCGFTLYNETFYYSLTQAQASQNQPPPMIIQDVNYYSNKMIFRTLIDSGNQAISYGDDITTAQNMYGQATYMRQNENDFF